MADATIPLAGWADDQLKAIATLTGSAAVGHLSGAAMLGERAGLNRFRILGRVSAGGGCRFFETRDGHVALNLSRPSDRELLPALFGDAAVVGYDDAALVARFRASATNALVAQGRTLGLAIAALDECPCSCESSSPACEVSLPPTKLLLSQEHIARPHRPLVVDLSALWAGPLASRLLMLTGSEVVKVESRNRPDTLRDGDPAFYARLNDGKTDLALDLREATDRDTLIALIRRADIVIEAARPRALLQLGIDAEALVREVPGLVWATITGHGIAGEAANWVGFGDDCGVAGGLSAALRDATGKIGFVGDAIADPLTGIFAARKIVEQRATGISARLIFSMAGVVAEALVIERARDAPALTSAFQHWATSEGRAFPQC